MGSYKRPMDNVMVQSTTITVPSAPASVKAFIQDGTLKHIAIIMDGNRRWAKDRGMPSPAGHYEGYKTLKTLLEYCAKSLQLPALTVYAFSTENWGRTPTEVDFLLKLFHQTLKKEIDTLIRLNIRLHFLGDLSGFSPAFQETCAEAKALTANNTGLQYQVALSYGGRAEIVEACRRIAEQIQNGRFQPQDITETILQQHLYTDTDLPDPDMVIRTGGASRLSNFLLWQSAYSEIFILEEHWPQFTPDLLNRTIEDFHYRQRRFGK